MSKKSGTVNMKVPADMVDQLQAYMAQMNVGVAAGWPSQAPQDPETEVMNDDGTMECEVSRVLKHRRRDDGGWEFEVTWKGYRTREWVRDEDCNCESAIADYLRTVGITTAYVFCRVSSPEQAQSTNVSLDAQRDELLTAVAGMNKFQRVRVYAISASAYKRIPQVLRRIGGACQAGDAILVWRVDRLSRNIEEYMDWIRTLHARGVTLYSHQEKITYADDKLPFLQAMLDAQREAAVLGERVKLAYRRKRARGDQRVGGLPYGKKYFAEINPDGTVKRKFVGLHPLEHAVTERIRKSKKTAQELADVLNQEGVKKRGKKWNKLMVLRLKKKD